QCIETHEMIDMCVGDENVGNAAEDGRRKGMDISEIKEQCPSFSDDPDQKARVSVAAVQEFMMESWLHFRSYVM
ncbi:MAG TPA: hypothetical protein VEP69_02585, partial [Thermodesulfovibrionales bacterium]|nr:hypothetical protein [Thermodesulfovibrionales bacterium]